MLGLKVWSVQGDVGGTAVMPEAFVGTARIEFGFN